MTVAARKSAEEEIQSRMTTTHGLHAQKLGKCSLPFVTARQNLPLNGLPGVRAKSGSTMAIMSALSTANPSVYTAASVMKRPI